VTATRDVAEDVVPADLSQHGFAVLVPGAGGYQAHPGSGTSEGRFRIPDAPILPRVLLRVSSPTEPPVFYDVDSRSIDLGSWVAGRPGAAFAAPGTKLDADITNLSPAFQQDDDFVVWMPNAGWREAWMFSVAFPMGVTAFVGLLDWEGLPLAAADDPIAIVHFENGKIVQRLDLPSFAIANGQTTPLAGAMMPVTADESVAVTIRHGAFAAQLGANDSNFVLESGLLLHPGGTARGFLFRAEAQTHHVATDPTVPDLPLTWEFTNPSGLAEIVLGEKHFRHSWSLPASTPVRLLVVDTTAVVATSSVDVAPIVGPVADTALDGVAIGGDTSVPLATGPGPLLSWSGTADDYHVTLYRIQASGGTTSAVMKAQLFTPQASIVLPRELFGVGERIGVKITARRGVLPGAPRRRAFPFGEATWFSGIVQLTAP
jgi:hypothetical protein